MKKNTFFKWIDNILIVIILLSIIQIFLDDLVILLQWPEKLHILFLWTGFCFDLIFSIEFIARSIVAIKKKDFKKYFIYENGWIDFMASIPLLLTNSGPAVIVMLLGKSVNASRGMLNMLKIVKSIRVTRILRLLRMLKIFGKIENVQSKMTQRHVSMIIVYVIASSVLAYMFFSLIGVMKFDDLMIETRVSLLFSIVMLVNVFAIAFLYARNFAQVLSDPLYVIKRGLAENDYNYTVKIHPYYKEDEIFQLAHVYNQVWLPTKVRIEAIRQKKSKPVYVEEESYEDLL